MKRKFDSFISEQIEDRCMLKEGIMDRGIFKAMMLGGVAGAGKSFVVKRIRSGGIEAKIVNTDTFTEYFMKQQKSLFRKDSVYSDIFPETATEPIQTSFHDLFYDSSKRLVMSQLALYFNSMLPLICEATSTSMNSIVRRKSILERLGYDIAMVFVNTDIDTAIDRMRKREREVPEEVIREFFEKTKQTKPYLKSKFPLYLEINNTEGEINDDVILKAFKRVESFFMAPVQNDIGQDTITWMKKSDYKYLSPDLYSMEEIKTFANQWYR